MKLNKAEKWVRKFKEDNPDLNGYGAFLAICKKFKIIDYADKPANIPPEYRKAIDRFYS